MAGFLRLIFLFIFVSSFGQTNNEISFLTLEEINRFQIPDSLKEKSYEDLETIFFNRINYFDEAKLYANIYIKKGKINQDTLQIANGYFLLNKISEDSTKLKCLDLIIELTKKANYRTHPALAYLAKGVFFEDQTNYQNALDNYFKSYNYALKNNIELAYKAKFNIGILKLKIGQYEEALDIFSNYNNFLASKKSKTPDDNALYLVSLFALSDSYTKTQKFDKASYKNTEGIQKSLSFNNDMYYYFVMNEGVNLFYKKKYKASIDSISKIIPFLRAQNDQTNIIFSHFYLGRSYYESGEIDISIKQFKKVDSLFNNYPDFFPEVREGYKILINHYKDINNKENQLFYLNRLITVDSILNESYKYINNKIKKGFDTPLLISEKEKLISDLHQSNSFKSSSIISLFIVLVIISIFLIFNYSKRKNYKRKFELLINQNNIAKNNADKEKEKQALTYLSGDIHNTIKKGLERFESNKEYLNQNVSISSLAKKMDTNSKYLSVFINQYEEKKFTDYINDLRIAHTIEKLKTDRRFRKYTIKAIAEAGGYSNPVSFSQAFYKKTGIKPSYFIKQLENNV